MAQLGSKFKGSGSLPVKLLIYIYVVPVMTWPSRGLPQGTLNPGLRRDDGAGGRMIISRHA